MRLSYRNIRIWSAELLILYIAALLFICMADFSGVPSPPKFLFNIPTDKVVHFLMFLPFPVIAWLFLKARIRNHDRWFRMLLIIFVCGLLLGILTETLQGMTDYRSKDYFDVVADASGTFAGCLLILLFIRKPYDSLLEKVKASCNKVA